MQTLTIQVRQRYCVHAAPPMSVVYPIQKCGGRSGSVGGSGVMMVGERGKGVACAGDKSDLGQTYVPCISSGYCGKHGSNAETFTSSTQEEVPVQRMQKKNTLNGESPQLRSAWNCEMPSSQPSSVHSYAPRVPSEHIEGLNVRACARSCDSGE